MRFKEMNKQFGTVLKVDIDRKNISWFTIKSLQYLSRHLTMQRLIIKRSPSRKGWHIIIGLKEKLNDYQIIVWQFALNSDKKRERYNLLRVLNGNPMKDWNILFDKKVNRPIKF